MDNKEEIKQLKMQLQESLDLNEQFSEALTRYEDENHFLAETVVVQELGNVVAERRSLLENVKKAKEEARLATEALEELKEDYKERFSKIESLMIEVKAKKDDVDAFIEKTAEDKTMEARENMAIFKFESEEAVAKTKADCAFQIAQIKSQRLKIILGLLIFNLVTTVVAFVLGHFL